MWALAIYDTVRRLARAVPRPLRGQAAVCLARDGVIAFGSEVKALLAHPDVPAAPDLAHGLQLRGAPLSLGRRLRSNVLRGDLEPAEGPRLDDPP